MHFPFVLLHTTTEGGTFHESEKTARILCTLSAAALCVSFISTNAFASTFNGGEYGTLKLNG